MGECAATGVHGANRLASNSLLEAVAFGRRTGRAAGAEASGLTPVLSVLASPVLSDIDLQTLRRAMSDHVGVVRDAQGLAQALAVIAELDSQTPDALPLITARLITQAALDRQESRGGHYRSDWPDLSAAPRHTRVRRDPAALIAAE